VGAAFQLGNGVVVIGLALQFGEVDAFALTPLFEQPEYLLESVAHLLDGTAIGMRIFTFAKIFEEVATTCERASFAAPIAVIEDAQDERDFERGIVSFGHAMADANFARS